MRSLLPLNGRSISNGKGRTQPRHGRGVLWCKAGTSLVLTYASFSLFVAHRQHRKINGVAYPLEDGSLIQLIEDDLSIWATDHGRPTKMPRSRTGKKRLRPSLTVTKKMGEPNADEKNIGTGTVKGRGKPTYHIPGPEELRKICPKYECTVVHIDTRPSSKREQGELIRFVNRDFDHLRLLWYGCSLNRAASKLQREGIHIHGYFVINVGDAYIEEGEANFPVWSKGSPVQGGEAKDTLDVMMPYEELLWSYPADDLTTPFSKKKATAVYRGGCTHPRRAEMVDAVRRAFPPPASDVAVSCRPDFTSLSPKEQGKYRCLLDYDGNGYSRRMAWYLQTGGVVMRGGDIDDVLSRIARNKILNGHGKEAPPVLFWNWNEEEDGNGASGESTNDDNSDDTGLISTVRKCLSDDIYAQDVSKSALDFWSKYVQEGQSVWDGFLAHLIVEQSRRLTLTVDEDEFNNIAPGGGGSVGWTQRHTIGEPLFQSLSQSNLVCSVVFDAVTPTGQSGRPRLGYIITCVALCLSVFSMSLLTVTPALGKLLQKSIKKTISTTAAAGAGSGGKNDGFIRVASRFGLAPKCR